MTNSIPNTADDDLLKEYDVSKGIRGKYVDRFKEGSNIVILSPELDEVFKNSAPPTPRSHADKILQESTRAEEENVIGKW